MNTADFQDIICAKEEDTGIVTVTLNRPETKNSMSFYTFWERCRAVDAVKADESARAVILTGARDPRRILIHLWRISLSANNSVS